MGIRRLQGKKKGGRSHHYQQEIKMFRTVVRHPSDVTMIAMEGLLAVTASENPLILLLWECLNGRCVAKCTPSPAASIIFVFVCAKLTTLLSGMVKSDSRINN